MTPLAQQIDACDDRATGAVFVREWKDAAGDPLRVLVRSWTSGDRADFDAETGFLAEHVDEPERERLTVSRVVAWCAVDEAGALVWDLPPAAERGVIDREPDPTARAARLDAYLAVYRRLALKNGKALHRIFRVASELNALSDDDEADIEKNSHGAGASSSSGSPSPSESPNRGSGETSPPAS